MQSIFQINLSESMNSSQRLSTTGYPHVYSKVQAQTKKAQKQRREYDQQSIEMASLELSRKQLERPYTPSNGTNIEIVDQSQEFAS